ncbi:MAG: glycoside hydrolase family 3 C-terminal domain-containing protein [Cytophagales bacterium]|nr:glycoside hydrolase family 3 C-terminal domain-containing protein [Cytophagales bacterium]
MSRSKVLIPSGTSICHKFPFQMTFERFLSHSLWLFGCLMLLQMNVSAQGTIDRSKDIEALLQRMTLEEKVGQMTQLTLDFISQGAAFDDNKEMVIAPAKLDSALKIHHVGSILNTGTYTLSREKWYELITQIQQVATKETRLKIPVLYGVDAIHGANYTLGATLFPQELALAATWNPMFASQAGSITAYEVRASAIPWNFSPVLDLGRQPLWSRFFETFGEDPYLATQMGVAMVKGYQGNDISNPEKVAACLKHYMGYSFSFNGKDRSPILMPERLMREYYLVPFENAIKNGAMTVMVNSAEINGTPVHANYHILTEILKEELKFDGFAVTDWEDIIMLHSVHKVAPTYKDAIAMSINAGIDMSMVPSDVNFCKYLIELVKEGRVPMTRIDDAVRRILRVKYKLGLFERPYMEMAYYKKFGSPEFSNTNYQAAAECLTLLKNSQNVLPLNSKNRILVTGVAANSLTPLNGAWTHTWQGRETKFNPKDKKTIYQAIQDKIGAAQVEWVEGTDYDVDINTSKAVSAAGRADVIVVCLGEKPATEKPGDIDDLTFDRVQLDLVKQLAKTGKPVVVVLSEARPRLITEIEPLVQGILMAYLSGNEGGRAIADVLFGVVNPSGKLPFTYPRYSGSLVTYDHKLSDERDREFGFKGFNPLYEFGHGQSYTEFAYSNFNLGKDAYAKGDSVSVSVEVKNIGKMAGKEVVKLFVKDEYATITPSVKRLKGFQKIALQPGESKLVSFKVSTKDLGFVNVNNQWVVEPGDFTVMIDKFSKKFVLQESKLGLK